MPNATELDAWSGDLVRRFCGGDVTSIDALMTRFRPVLVGAARRHVYASQDVEDVVQETWLAFVTKAAQIREPERVVGWLRTTATNVARRLAMRNARTELVDDAMIERVLPSFEDDVTTLAVDRTRRDAFEEAVEQLSDPDQHLVSLLIDERGLSYGAIGGLLERPIGSIGPSRSRVVDKIRRQPIVKALLEADSADCGADQRLPAGASI
jgi:RNA polymerase sigma factor (sigma-70 family)